MQYTATRPRACACIFQKTPGLMSYLLTHTTLTHYLEKLTYDRHDNDELDGVRVEFEVDRFGEEDRPHHASLGCGEPWAIKVQVCSESAWLQKSTVKHLNSLFDRDIKALQMNTCRINFLIEHFQQSA